MILFSAFILMKLHKLLVTIAYFISPTITAVSKNPFAICNISKPWMTRFPLHLEGFCVNQSHNSYRLEQGCYIKNFIWDPLWQTLLSSYSICALCLTNLPGPLSSFHPALCNRKLIINRLPCPVSSSWGSSKEKHQQELGEQEGGKVETIILAPSPDLCVLVAPARGIFSIRLSFPKYPSVTSNLGMETAPCFANPGVLNCLLLVSQSTTHSLVSGPLIKLPSIYPKRMCF